MVLGKPSEKNLNFCVQKPISSLLIHHSLVLYHLKLIATLVCFLSRNVTNRQKLCWALKHYGMHSHFFKVVLEGEMSFWPEKKLTSKS